MPVYNKPEIEWTETNNNNSNNRNNQEATHKSLNKVLAVLLETTTIRTVNGWFARWGGGGGVVLRGYQKAKNEIQCQLPNKVRMSQWRKGEGGGATP